MSYSGETAATSLNGVTKGIRAALEGPTEDNPVVYAYEVRAALLAVLDVADEWWSSGYPVREDHADDIYAAISEALNLTD